MVSERTKNPAKQNSCPVVGRFREIFLFRRSPIIVFYIFIKNPSAAFRKIFQKKQGDLFNMFCNYSNCFSVSFDRSNNK